MTKKLSKLDSIQIPKPCPVAWEQMLGDDQTRFCNECNKQVYNLSAMTRRRAEAIIEASHGKLCARVTREADGTVLVTDDFILPTPNLHHLNRRASPIASAVVSAMMAISPVVVAQTHSQTEKPDSVISQNGQKKPGAQPQETTSKLSGSVLNPQGAVITNATVTLVNQSTGEMRGTISKEDGTFQFEMLKPDSYSLKVESVGFASSQLVNINLQQNQQQRVDVSMPVMEHVALRGVMARRAQPLRTLYDESDLVVVATPGNSVKVETERETVRMKTALNVSLTLKGEAKKSVVYVYHWVYGEEDKTFVGDKNLLVFLKRSKQEKARNDGYEVDDISFGVKRLSDADLKIYTQRIAELAKIMKAEKLDESELVEWLVRCAEEKATRFEGISELAKSFRQLRYREEAKEEEEVEESEDVEGEEESAMEIEADEAADEPEDVEEENQEYLKITSLLTKQQKDRLMAILYNTEELTDEESDLIELAKAWQDARLVPFLIAQLRRMENAPTDFAVTIIDELVELLDDEEVEEAANEYTENASYEDEAEDDDDEAGTAKSKKPEIGKDTQERTQLLKTFLSAVESKIKK